MALANLPLSDSFRLCWSRDPSLDSDRENFDDEYLRCVERLDFAPLLKEGQQPTWFVFRPVPLREILDAGHGALEASSLLFRMALVKVENGPDWLPKLDKKVSQQFPKFGPMVDRKVTDLLDQMCADLGIGYGHLVTELGSAVFQRLSGLSPK